MFDRKLHFLRHLDGVLKIRFLVIRNSKNLKEKYFFKFEKYCTSGNKILKSRYGDQSTQINFEENCLDLEIFLLSKYKFQLNLHSTTI